MTPKSSGRKHNIIKGRSELKETVLFINPVIIAQVYKFSKNTTMGMHCNPGHIKALKDLGKRRVGSFSFITFKVLTDLPLDKFLCFSENKY